MNAVETRPVRKWSVLKYINLSIAVLIIFAAAVVYWVAYRPLPQVSGELAAPISGPATITRDSLGVPHIRAANIEDAMFLQGFVTAQDRLWQMDALRRLAAGELAAIVGPHALKIDEDARRLRTRRTAEEHARTLAPGDRAVLAAYARGVNFFIEQNQHRLPLEFTLLRYSPRPWTIADCILAGLQMYRNLTTSWDDELEKQNMLVGGDPAKVNFLYASRTGREFQPGSNSWAISGKHTASGKPILANDPHLEYSAPATWYMVHLQAPGLNVSGVSLPGVPAVIVGHNDRIAWGVTNLGFDVQDLYREKLDPNTGRYLFRGQIMQARLERELIAVKGAKPVELAIWVTQHGPVMIAENQQFLAMRWAASEPGSFQFPFLQINRAGNWSEFNAAIARFSGPGQNFVYADVDGNIGYHATGMLPIRRGYDGSVPVDGSSGNYEWQGFIPFDQLPTFYNPPSGEIVTANQNPFPLDYPYPVHGNFAPEYRSRQIRNMLNAKQGFQPPDMLVIQKDVYSAFMLRLARYVVAAYDRKHPSDPEVASAVNILRKWNGQVEKGTPAPLITALIYPELRRRVADSASPGKRDVYDFQIAPSIVQSILDMHGNGWFKDQDDVLLSCLSDAIAQGRKFQGGHLEKWDYGKYNELLITQPVGNQIPLVAKYFNIGPFPMSGGSTTVKQTTQRLGPSMRFVADLSDWDRSLNNITVGESGEILSSHYSDQWDAYYVGRSFPMQFHNVDAKSVLTVKPAR